MKHLRSDWKTKWTPFLRQIAWLDFSVTATFVRRSRLGWIFVTFMRFYFKTVVGSIDFASSERFGCTLIDAERLASRHVRESVAVTAAAFKLELFAESNRWVVVVIGFADSIGITEESRVRWAYAFINCFEIFLLIFFLCLMIHNWHVKPPQWTSAIKAATKKLSRNIFMISKKLQSRDNIKVPTKMRSKVL